LNIESKNFKIDKGEIQDEHHECKWSGRRSHC
jgi:hypothetical protein